MHRMWHIFHRISIRCFFFFMKHTSAELANEYHSVKKKIRPFAVLEEFFFFFDLQLICLQTRKQEPHQSNSSASFE